MPDNDEATSLGAIGRSAQNGAVAFATTHWSVVLTAQDESPAAQEALEKLCRAYWRPIYSFVRRQGVGPEEAEDLTQGFFALLLERRDLSAAEERPADSRAAPMAIKRGSDDWAGGAACE